MPLHDELIKAIKNYTNGFHAIVPFNAENDKLLKLDFTEENKELTEELINDTECFSQYVNAKLKMANAAYGIGGYDEHRTLYKRSAVFDGDEPRRLHLGIDIWGEADTPVYAPMPGTVHSFNFNNAFGDYGATIILQHKIEDFYFHTLFGHVSLKSIENLKEGETIEKGQWIGSFGRAEENGHWPPHLHFQIVIDMQGMKGDYPGVCALAEREKYLSNCPDPDLILGMVS